MPIEKDSDEKNHKIFLTNFDGVISMISLREVADNNSEISSTRWAFGLIIIFDIVIITLSIAAFLVAHFIGMPLDGSFFGYVATLLGVVTTLVTTGKALQGFETKRDDKPRHEMFEPDIIEEK